jgi:hypothetical protein
MSKKTVISKEGDNCQQVGYAFSQNSLPLGNAFANLPLIRRSGS